MKTRLNKKFFAQKTEKVAKQLLGKSLVHQSKEATFKGVITETEAYVGPNDLASHASKGKTDRTKVMFREAGFWYVYMIYGFYYCLNIVTEEKNHPAAVLIRSVEPISGINKMKRLRKTDQTENLTNGPGKLCQAFKIDKNHNDTSATNTKSILYLETNQKIIKSKDIKRRPRIGIDYAKEWKDKLLRFYIKDSQFISKK